MNMKKLLAGTALSVALAAGPVLAQNQLPAIQGPNGPVLADPVVQIGYDSLTGLACVIGKTPTCSLAPISVTATISPFTVVGTSTPITTGGTTANTALVATSTIEVLTNTGSFDLYYKLGTSNAVTAAATDNYLGAGRSISVAAGANTFIAAISPGGASQLTIVGGTGGNPALSGGGGSGGGGGAITAAANSFASGYSSDLGTLSTSAVCGTDTGVCDLLGLTKRNNARLTSILTALGSPFQAGASIGNTSFGISGTLPAFASTPTFNLGTLNGAATAALQGAQGTGSTYNPPTGGSGSIGYESGIYAAAIDPTPVDVNLSKVNGNVPTICNSHAFYDASDNGKKTVVAGVSAKKTYICGFTLATGSTATNLSLTSGTGSDCVTTSTAITPAYQLVANDRVGFNAAFWNGLITLANADNLCVNASAGNPHQVEIWYIIQ